MKLYLIRHGVTDANASNVIQGHQPTPLNDAGRRQARRLADRLASSGPCFDLLICSDLPRAAQTAQAIAETCHTPVTFDRAWRERGFGEWEGMARTEGEIWQAASGEFTPPGAESPDQFRDRIVGALISLPMRRPQVSAAAVVTHGGPCRMVLRLLAEGVLPLEPGAPRPEVQNIANCSIMHLQTTGQPPVIRWKLLRLNDVDHLADPD